MTRRGSRLTMLLALLLLALSAGGRTSIASAVVIRPEVAAFGADGTSSSSFTDNNSIAFDHNTKRLLVSSGGLPSGIFGFDASGSLPLPRLSGFSPLPAPAPNPASGLAVDKSALSTAGNIYYSPGIYGPNPFVYGFNEAGSALGGNFPIDPTLHPGPSSPLAANICGTAVDSEGNLWVANYGLGRLLKYSPTGVFEKSIDTLGPQQLDACNIAFDSNDDLYAGADSFPTWKYTASSDYSIATKFDDQGSLAIAVDPVSHHVFIAHLSGGITEYDENGNALSVAAKLIPEASPGVPNARFKGLAVDHEHDRLYASDSGNGKVRVFGTGLTYPDLTLGGASPVENTTATVNGTISAQGVALTNCHFEYINAYEATGFNDLSSGGSVPCSPAAGSIPIDTALHPVSATLSGLAPNTPYRFRLLAANANGVIAAANIGSFETLGPAIVETTGSPVRTTTSALLSGRVSPQGTAGIYHFEYGDEGPCDSNPCISTADREAGSGGEFEFVAQRVEGLEPNTTYHYRLIADNGNPAGATIGRDMTLTTLAGAAEALSHGRFPGPPGSDRAWEMASAPDTGGNPVGVSFAPAVDALATAGDRVVYGVAGGTPQSEGGTFSTRLFAERTPSGWQTKATYPSREEATGARWLSPGGSPDLSSMVVENFPGGSEGEFSVWRMFPDASPVKLFSAPDTTTRGGFLAVAEEGPRVLATLRGSQDPAHPVEPETENLYDISSGGTPQLVDLLPDGTVPSCGVEQGTNSNGFPDGTDSSHWLSADGSLAFFPGRRSCGSPKNIYMRNLVSETTKLISGPSVSGPECGASFIKSIPGAAFIYSECRLSAEDVEPGSGSGAYDGDIYRYDIGGGTLKCVTCVVPGLDAGVRFGGNAAQITSSIGISEDGSRAYFSAGHRLLPGAPAGEGLYRVDVESGDLAYVGPFHFGEGIADSVEMSTDGSVLAIRSGVAGLNALNGQQNGDTPQNYLYDDRDRSLVCVSCPADGSAPILSSGRSALSADGNDFAFTTTLPLSPADQNTARAGQDPSSGTDVYEWRKGRLLLVSDGLTNWPGGETPEVGAITHSGHDIFFSEAAQLTPDALDGYRRLYDARIGGGFEFPLPPKPCPLEVCQGIPKGEPEEAAPGTASLAGAGNAKVHKAKAKKKRHKKKRHAKKANHKRRASR